MKQSIPRDYQQRVEELFDNKPQSWWQRNRLEINRYCEEVLISALLVALALFVGTVLFVALAF